MRPLKAKQRGFAITEIVIALLIIGTLAALILNSLQIVQAKSRDAKRRDEIDAIASQLEGCFKATCQGSYPSLIQLTDTSDGGFVTTNFKNFSIDNLYDTSNGIIQANNASAATQYQYQTMPEGCTGTSGDKPCSGYTLQSFQETNPDHPYVKESLNK